MTAKAALALALLQGRVLNVKNCFELIGLTNCSREISRMIEQPFGVIVSRTKRIGVSRYGQSVTWVDFRLNNALHNEEGISKMRTYVKEQMATAPPKTEKQKKELKQAELFI